MEIKVKDLRKFNYILSFDLAKTFSGYSLAKYENGEIQIIKHGIVDCTHDDNEFWLNFYNKFKEIILSIVHYIGHDRIDELIVTKEQLPQQAGTRSSIQSLQGLAQAHAIVDLLIAQFGLQYYNNTGVHSISVKSYFKRITGIEKPQKEDIRDFISGNYNLIFEDKKHFDDSDSIAVTITLVYNKWFQDIKEEIKELNKKKKTLKSDKSKNEIDLAIEKLKNMKEGIQDAEEGQNDCL